MYTYQTSSLTLPQTFSKTAAPGSRLGWFTTSPLFIERLTRATEASTQAPSGFATAVTATMLKTYGFDGYIRWLRGIKATYRMRKTWICDILDDVFHLEFDQNTNGLSTNPAVLSPFGNLGRGVTCYSRSTKQGAWDEKRGLTGGAHGPPLISFIPPTGEPQIHRQCLSGDNADQTLSWNVHLPCHSH
jgi:aromatic amino acid aminotransferase I